MKYIKLLIKIEKFYKFTLIIIIKLNIYLIYMDNINFKNFLNKIKNVTPYFYL